MQPESFSIQIQDEFQKCINQSDWLLKTWHQLRKDFTLSGLKLEDKLLIDANDMFETLNKAVKNAKQDKRFFEQLLYRIDLPKTLNAEMLEIESLTEVLILRSFQKVWLRKYYNK